jgi:hypothetical protein
MRLSLKNFFVNAALVLASTLFTVMLVVAAGEVVLRWKYGSLPTQKHVGMIGFDEARGWVMRPGRYSYFQVAAVRRMDVTINELGLRNRSISREPQPGVQRIMVVGDSFVFGTPLGQDDIVTARLQALAGDSFEVVNLGVPGYGTGQQLRLVEELHAKGYRLGRKLVLAFFTNDLQDNLGLNYATLDRNPLQPVFSVDAAGNLQQTPGQRPPEALGDSTGSWLDRSLFGEVLRYQLQALAVSQPGILRALEAVGMAPALPYTPGIIAGWYADEWQARWSVTAGVLEYFVKAVRAIPDAPELFIAFVPSGFQVQESFKLTIAASANGDARYAAFLSDPDRPQRVLQALARRLDVQFIDLTPAMRRAAAHSVLYFPRDGHFNELGADVAAQVIFEQAIKESGKTFAGLRASERREVDGK